MSVSTLVILLVLAPCLVAALVVGFVRPVRWSIGAAIAISALMFALVLRPWEWRLEPFGSNASGYIEYTTCARGGSCLSYRVAANGESDPVTIGARTRETGSTLQDRGQLSPDGTKKVLIVGGGPYTLQMFEGGAPPVTLLSDVSGVDTLILWSPNSRYVLVRVGALGNELKVIDTKTRVSWKVGKGWAGWALDPIWSPDSRNIAFVAIRYESIHEPTSREELHVIDRDGSHNEQVAQIENGYFTGILVWAASNRYGQEGGE